MTGHDSPESAVTMLRNTQLAMPLPWFMAGMVCLLLPVLAKVSR
jgi:hypothetical protein